jgi:hypothetical protein
MSEEVVDTAIKTFNLKPKLDKSITKIFQLFYSQDYDDLLYFSLIKDFDLNFDIAKHLTNTYGKQNKL